MSDAEEGPTPVSAARLCAMLLLSPSKAFRRLREEPLEKAGTWHGSLLLINLFLTGVAACFRYQYLVTSWPHGYHPPLFLSLAGTLLSTPYH